MGVIGVLDLQGGVHEHLEHLERLGLPYKRVKQAADFAGLIGLIIPGGESTCLARLLTIFDLKDVILQHYNRGMKIWGTCAGAILLADKVVGDPSCLGLIDMAIERNSFGSQLDSFKAEARIPAVSNETIPLIFIRAPKILSAGKDVKILLRMDDYIAAAETDGILVTVFHPELTGCLAFHRYFALKCGLNCDAENASTVNQDWKNVSWMKLARIAS
ncbi:MAG: pyridoxal 5'-phosphate synthase glutaminase subunit PdxT [Deltaproteobacteria bacterium HGW-Deltaproteobacteria-6]|nr:MAG: pyridoxal 5'-phosphate synthase glutaminase subunit PdxT [Deltaproteobacteria bacterium HGW-Deltaproteobacteria-6]